MSPAIRKLALTVHVATSVGWLGSVGAFLALALVGLGSETAERARAAYVAMDVVAWFVIVPLCLASFVSGVVQALGTPWGLFRHYWVIVKLIITVLATVLLMLHMQPISSLARVAAEGSVLGEELHPVRTKLVANAIAAVVALLVTTTLSVFKPRGLTEYGRRKAARA